MTAQETYDSQIECPLCRSEGLVTPSGRVPHLWVQPFRRPALACVGVHGPLADDVLVAHGIDPTPPTASASGLAPSRPTDHVPDAEPTTTPPPVGPPDDVSGVEHESAYRDAPIGDVGQEPLEDPEP